MQHLGYLPKHTAQTWQLQVCGTVCTRPSHAGLSVFGLVIQAIICLLLVMLPVTEALAKYSTQAIICLTFSSQHAPVSRHLYPAPSWLLLLAFCCWPADMLWSCDDGRPGCRRRAVGGVSRLHALGAGHLSGPAATQLAKQR
jgi:hypothetical protein